MSKRSRPHSPDIFAALIVASGRGQRAAQAGAAPKQYRLIGTQPVLTHTLKAFQSHEKIASIQVVINAEDKVLYQDAASGVSKALPPVTGGTTRQLSVKNGLEALAALKAPPSYVLIHDGVRPFITRQTLSRICESLLQTPAVIVGTPLTDSLKRVDADMKITASPTREGLFGAQTPQAFRFFDILKAHRCAFKAGLCDFTDDASLAEWDGLDVHLIAGEPNNIKLTYAHDFAIAQNLIAPSTQEHKPMETRIGQGFDVHAFEPGERIILGGLSIPFDKSLKGHSDADVVLHAITDAVFGALADGDIGQHFPPGEPQWHKASSDQFLAYACERCLKRSGRIVSVDVTVICERPKLAPYCEEMRARIAEIMKLSVSRISVKATTSERLGFTGREEGIASLAVVSILLPDGDCGEV